MIKDAEKQEDVGEMKEAEIEDDRFSDIYLNEEKEELGENEKNNQQKLKKRKILTLFLRFVESGNLLIVILILLLLIYEMTKDMLFSG